MKSKLFRSIDVFYKFSSVSLERARQILGVSEKATHEEINRAYKKQIKEVHPDKLHHLPEEARKEFGLLALELNLARDLLLKQSVNEELKINKTPSYEHYLQLKKEQEQEWRDFLSGMILFEELRFPENTEKAKKIKVNLYG